MSDSSVNDFALVRRALLAGNVDGKRTNKPAFDRLLSALESKTSFRPRTSLDMAVLIRHALRYETAHRSAIDVHPYLIAPNRSDMPSIEKWQTVGIRQDINEQGQMLTARPWEPNWLLPTGTPCDLRVVREEFLRRNDWEGHSPDPFLKALGKDFGVYRSPGQRVAIRSALIAPPGGTLLISLPTGEGKSLVFESLSHFGNGRGLPGVIPVIVPTVALALDHEKSEQRRLNTDRPFAYVGGDKSRPEIIDAIKNGQQGLCFMAPESACGALQSSLLQAAREGYISAFVIDEAHLVEAWGSDFRTSFPLLSALRAKMMAQENPDYRARTILLSATLTQMAVNTLESLFADGQMAIVNGSRIRPELLFFKAPISDEEVRQERVLEAVAHMPRPLILYASKPDEVEKWYDLLREEGYGNLASFHGDTRPEDRKHILNAWRSGSLDMVVGNSAFGLGIDYAHVRSVIHACIPETLDRFYQEVGRGGRDGRASMSVLIPAHSDRHVAESLNRQKIITLERGQQRWNSMFKHPERRTLDGQHRYAIRLNVSPSNEQEDLKMVGLRSVDWNDRILTVMARTGLIRILNRYKDIETTYPWADIEILRYDHDTEEAWNEIGLLRADIRDNNSRNLDAIMQYIRGETCLAPLLVDIYTTDMFNAYERIVPVCSCCPVCGCEGNGQEIDVPIPAYPWGVTTTIGEGIAKRFDHNGLLVVEYQAGNYLSSRFQRELRETLQNLIEYGFRNMLILGPSHEDIGEKALTFGVQMPFFISRGKNWLDRSLLPAGPDIVFMLPGFEQTTHLQCGGDHQMRLVFMPDNMSDPSKPSNLYLDTYAGNSIRFAIFRNMVRI